MQKKCANLDQDYLCYLLEQCRPQTEKGVLPVYIPALLQANPSHLGVCVADRQGRVLIAGEADVQFSIQSIVKILIFACCLMDSGHETVAEKVSVEPTNDGFNLITSLELRNNNKPLNPMINAGAIVCLTMVKGETLEEKGKRILQFARDLAGNQSLSVDETVYQSERRTGSRNRAISYYLKSTGIILEDMDVEALLDAYFRVCSISVNCTDLAQIALILANRGADLVERRQWMDRQTARIIKATMVMCGMYNESGQVAVSIGLPTKSGVGGGILSLVPDKMGIGIYGPALNDKGSSAAGLALLESLSRHLDASIFK